jgi:hypothetical protein
MGLGDGKAYFGLFHHLGPFFFFFVGVTKLPTQCVISSPPSVGNIKKGILSPYMEFLAQNFFEKGPRDKFEAIDTFYGSLAQFFKFFKG